MVRQILKQKMECQADLVLGNSDKEKKIAKTIIDVSFI